MESDAENAKEIETYSFLLGSAIRNEDTNQFLSIYDSILPSGLSEKQVFYSYRCQGHICFEEFQHVFHVYLVCQLWSQ